MPRDDSLSRRSFVGTVAGAAAVGLAGCGDGQSGEDGPDDPTDTETTATDTDTATESGTDTPTDAGTETEAETETEREDETGIEDETETEDGEGDDGPYRNGVGADASVSFAVPADGAGLSSPSVNWDAEAEGVTIEESGAVTEGAGHYHVLVDTEPVEAGETIPTDDAHRHFGTGQTDGVVEVEPGEHTLHLQVGDGEHVAMDGLTDAVEVTVADEATLNVETTVDGSVVEWEATAENYEIEPADEGVNPDAGHLHAIVDADPVAVGEVIPTDDTHVHFGDGSTSGEIDLAEQLGDGYEAGEHTIYVQVGTGTHRATAIQAEATVETE